MTSAGPLHAHVDALVTAVCDHLADSSRSPEACRRDVQHQVEALDQALAAQQPAQFGEMVAWLAFYLEAIGVDPNDVVRGLEQLEASLTSLPEATLSQEAQAAVQAARARVLNPSGFIACVHAPPSPEAVEEDPAAWIGARRDRLAALTVAMHYMRRPADGIRHGDKQWRCLEDAGFHLDHLAEALSADDPALFTAYLDWCRVVLARLGLEHELADHLRAFRDALVAEAPAAIGQKLAGFIDVGLTRLASEASDLPSFLDPAAPHAALGRAYLDALLARDRRGACRLVVEAVTAGAPVAEIYRHVFQPCQHEVGRLWQVGKISVAQEHYCTAATQMAMSQLYPHIFAERRRNRTIVATCVGGNMHEIGVRFVADMFELDGWDSIYLGADTPTDHVLREVVERDADVLAISATLSTHIAGIRELIAAVRAHPQAGAVKILVGGFPFSLVPTLWRTVGADGSAPNAHEAIAIAGQLLEDAAA